MSDLERLRGELGTAQTEALRVHDSPPRADKLYRDLERISRRVAGSGLGEEQAARVSAALADAMRVLRRDDDGREAAKHLQSALGQFEKREPRPSPFLDDL